MTAVMGNEIDAERADKGANGDADVNVAEARKSTDAAVTPPPTTTPTTPAVAASSRAPLPRKKLPPPPTKDAPLLSVAPMMDWTDVHYRSLARLMTRKSWLYTEMVVDTTLIHNPDVGRFLEFPESQRPIVCQLGGSDPSKLAAAAAVAARYGYDEINLNCGCPSDRVAGAGCFGASLMREPSRVAAACKAMREAVRKVEARGEAGAAMREVGGWGGGGKGSGKEEVEISPDAYRPPKEIDVTVKCRLGVDDLDSYSALCDFVHIVFTEGHVTHFVVHARKCLLQGLSPAQNRSVPPLRHGWVFALKRDFPNLKFTLNGGMESTAAARDVLLHDFGSVEAAAAAAGEEKAAEAPAAAAAANADGGGNKEERAAAAAAPSSSSSPSSFLLEGTMIGRAAYHSPWSVLGGADVELWGETQNGARNRREILELYAEYCETALANSDAAARREGGKSGTRRRPSARTLAAPLLGLFHGEPGGKRWRFEIDQALRPPGGGRKQQGGRKKRQKKTEGQQGGGGGEGGKEEEEEEEEIEERGPSMRDVIAHASKAVPAFVLDAPPPTGDKVDGIAKAAARAAEVAAEAAAKHAAKKKKGPLPAPAKPLMGMPPPAVKEVGDAAAEAAAPATVEVAVEAE